MSRRKGGSPAASTGDLSGEPQHETGSSVRADDLPRKPDIDPFGETERTGPPLRAWSGRTAPCCPTCCGAPERSGPPRRSQGDALAVPLMVLRRADGAGAAPDGGWRRADGGGAAPTVAGAAETVAAPRRR